MKYLLKLINKKKLLLFLLFFAISCNEDILTIENQDSYNTDNYFKTPVEIEKATNAVYASFYSNSMFAWRWPEMFDALANEISLTAACECDLVASSFYKYQYNNTSSPIAGYWRLLYKIILRSNLVIDIANAYQAEKGKNAVVTRSLGEAYFLRGWSYSQLAFYYGRVPLRFTFDQSGMDKPGHIRPCINGGI